MSQDITTSDRPAKREFTQVISNHAIYDTARFEHLMRIAQLMAECSLIPESLYANRKGNEVDYLAHKTVVANCYLVVSYAERIGFDPFLVAQSCSVVRGRLMFEGKLIAAALDSQLGVALDYQFGTWDAETESCVVGLEGKGDALGIRVTGTLADGTVKVIDGSVGTWKTTGDKSPWRPGSFKRMLRYRGAREWARAHKPSIMLGFAADDEVDAIENEAGARNARLVGSSSAETSGLASRLQKARENDALPAPQGGFSINTIGRELDGVSSEGVAPSRPAAAQHLQPESERQAAAPVGANAGGGHVNESAAAREPHGESTGQAQTRGGTGGLSVTSSGGEQLGTDSQTSPRDTSPATGEKEDEPDTAPSDPKSGSSSSPSISRDQFVTYSMSLARATKKTSLDHYDKQSRNVIVEALGGRPSPTDIAVVNQIFALHGQRTDGKIEAGAIGDEVDAILAQHFGEAE